VSCDKTVGNLRTVHFLREAVQLRSDAYEFCISEGTAMTFCWCGGLDRFIVTYWYWNSFRILCTKNYSNRLIFTVRRYASVLLGDVILSVRLFVTCLLCD